MASRLYHLGSWSFKHRWAVLISWVLLLVVLIACSAAFSKPTNAPFTIPGTPAQNAIDLLNKKFPGAGGGSARIVFEAPPGQQITSPKNRAAVEAALAKVRALIGKPNGPLDVIDPYEAATFGVTTISPNQAIAYADVPYPIPAEEIADSARDQLAATAAPARAAGLTVAFGGGIVTTKSGSESESIGVVIAYIVLTIALSSLLAALFPLIVALLGVSVGLMAITALTGVIHMSSTAPVLALMLGLAVGIDYALFILSRHRQGLSEGLDPHDAAALATGTAGGAVVFAGVTVVIALAGLALLGIPFLSIMGFAACLTVAVAVLISLTLLPALLGFGGARLDPRRREAKKAAKAEAAGKTVAPPKPPASERWATFVSRHRVAVLGVGVVALLVIAIPGGKLKLGLPDAGSSPTKATERQAYDLLNKGFGPGFNGPLTIVVDAPPNSNAVKFAHEAAQGLAALKVADVSPPQMNKAGDITVVQVTPHTGPTDDATGKLVDRIRGAAGTVQKQTGVAVLVTGTTAANIDVSSKLSSALPTYIIVVVGLALILLMLVFRSLAIPISAVIGFLLSVAAAIGVVVLVFQDGNLKDLFLVPKAGPVISFLPVLLIGILFGLAMDYEVFLVSRMRERFIETDDPSGSVISGLAQSGRVVTAAAIIMFSVFASFIYGDDGTIRSIGLALAFGVLVDAFVVRMTLIPAVLMLLGRTSWHLPRFLDRILPNVDIEGTTLVEKVKSGEKEEVKTA